MKRFFLAAAVLVFVGMAHAEELSGQGNGYHPTDPVESAVLADLMEAGLSNAASTNALDVLMKKTPGRCLDLAGELLAHKIVGDDAVSATEKACILIANDVQPVDNGKQSYTAAGPVTVVGNAVGEWRAMHDPVGLPSLKFLSKQRLELVVFWTQPNTRHAAQQAGATLIIPGQYFDCSEKHVMLRFSDGDALPLEGGGQCLPDKYPERSTAVVVWTKNTAKLNKSVALKILKDVYPVSIIYNRQEIKLWGSGFEEAASEYRRDIDPGLNPDFYDKFGIAP